uniref:Uncharacterized protein n=1 Tax=Toxoplasma gondii (strain ATCC 50861 / VEG) TaxID=432359 RepID=A0A0F7UTQ2_TOXGV|nr:TPA: hypothetical protein BN1205_014600 [Toxoplasma gondii VEG]
MADDWPLSSTEGKRQTLTVEFRLLRCRTVNTHSVVGAVALRRISSESVVVRPRHRGKRAVLAGAASVCATRSFFMSTERRGRGGKFRELRNSQVRGRMPRERKRGFRGNVQRSRSPYLATRGTGENRHSTRSGTLKRICRRGRTIDSAVSRQLSDTATSGARPESPQEECSFAMKRDPQLMPCTTPRFLKGLKDARQTNTLHQTWTSYSGVDSDSRTQPPGLHLSNRHVHFFCTLVLEATHINAWTNAYITSTKRFMQKWLLRMYIYIYILS